MATNLTRVRVEDDTSVGRSYTSSVVLTQNIVPGLGRKRAELTSKSFNPGKEVALESATLKLCQLNTCSRDDVLTYFRNTWELTNTLFSGLKNDSVFYAVPDKLRRPLIFYFAHPAAVYANKMYLAGLVDQINPFLQKLFETGVDEMSWDDMDAMQDENFAWPDVAEADAFRGVVKAAVERFILSMPPPSEVPVDMSNPAWALFMGFEHERIHLETSSVLIRQLPIDSVVQPEGWRTAGTLSPSAADAPKNDLIEVPTGSASIGKPREYPSFGWDNEYGRRDAVVPAFAASKFLVTNAEFLPFVLKGGYAEQRWWVDPISGDDEGWRWCQYRNATHPSFWVVPAHADMAKYIGGRPGIPYQKDDGHAARAGSGTEFCLRVEFDIIPMPWDWPCEVNYLEAAAFLRWKGANDTSTYRLLTEAEYIRCRAEPNAFEPTPHASVADNTATCASEAEGKVLPSSGDPLRLASDAEYCDIMLRDSAPGNVNFRWHSSTPVQWYPPSAAGFYDAHGNVWQWTEDHFAPLPGFEIHYLYDDFSSPCFDGWHTVIMGGSWASTGDLASSFARYHFRRHFFQHSGFRYVRVAAPEAFRGAATVENLWEKGTAVVNALASSYGPASDRLGPLVAAGDLTAAYSERLAAVVANAAVAAGLEVPTARVLHLGCGVGAGSFALARAGFVHVVAVDSDEPSIRHARIMKHHGQFEYNRPTEGVLTESIVSTSGSTPAHRSAVDFVLGDLCNDSLEGATGIFDVVVIDGALTRCLRPLNVLKRASCVVREGGLLIVASDNDWNSTVTPRSSWCGGFKMNAEEMTTIGMLTHSLKRTFTPLGPAVTVPHVTRYHSRKYTVDLMQVSLWHRNSATASPTA